MQPTLIDTNTNLLMISLNGPKACSWQLVDVNLLDKSLKTSRSEPTCKERLEELHDMIGVCLVGLHHLYILTQRRESLM